MTNDNNHRNVHCEQNRHGEPPAAAEEARTRWRWRRWLVVAVLVVAAIIWLYIMAGGEIAGMWNLVQDKVNVAARAHPAYLCLAIAILPLLGFPVSALYVLTGIIHGFAVGTALAWTGLFINLILSYLIAAWLFRAPLQSLLIKGGYSIPTIQPADITRTILIIRLTPAFPYFVQNYLLGLGRIPFARYLILSVLLQFPMAALAIATGGALFEGRIGIALVALSFLVAAALVYGMLRKHLREKHH